MAQQITQYQRPYLDAQYQEDSVHLNEWENNHPLNRLRLHIRQLHSVLEHVDQLLTSLEEERDQAIDTYIALHAENKKLKRILHETGKTAGSVSGEQRKVKA